MIYYSDILKIVMNIVSGYLSVIMLESPMKILLSL